jgi:hypothetical protein
LDDFLKPWPGNCRISLVDKGRDEFCFATNRIFKSEARKQSDVSHHHSNLPGFFALM